MRGPAIIAFVVADTILMALVGLGVWRYIAFADQIEALQARVIPDDPPALARGLDDLPPLLRAHVERVLGPGGIDGRVRGVRLTYSGRWRGAVDQAPSRLMVDQTTATASLRFVRRLTIERLPVIPDVGVEALMLPDVARYEERTAGILENGASFSLEGITGGEQADGILSLTYTGLTAIAWVPELLLMDPELSFPEGDDGVTRLQKGQAVLDLTFAGDEQALQSIGARSRPRGTEQGVVSEAWTVEFSDWRDVAGRHVPTQLRTIWGEPPRTLTAVELDLDSLTLLRE